MHLSLSKPMAAAFVLLCSVTVTLFAQQYPPPKAKPLLPRVVPPVTCEVFRPACSTEKLNGDCHVNIDRRYPITMPTYRLHRGSHVTVCVFHSFPFEAPTLDAGAPSAYEGTDQASALVTSLLSYGKGAAFGITSYSTMNATAQIDYQQNVASLSPQLDGSFNRSRNELQNQTNPPKLLTLEHGINTELQQLNGVLTTAIGPVENYFIDTNSIYARIREIESAVPRPVGDVKNTELLASGVPKDRTNPWNDYKTWKTEMITVLRAQGGDTSTLLNDLPGPCYKKGEAPPPTGLWLAAPRRCQPNNTSNTTAQPPKTPLTIPSNYSKLYDEITSNLDTLTKLLRSCNENPSNPSEDCRDSADVQKSLGDIDASLKAITERHERVAEALSDANSLLAGIISKITPDMQNLFENIQLTPDTAPVDPVMVGVIPGPKSVPVTDNEKKYLVPYKALAPTITYTLNEQNEIANALLSLPGTTQKQSIATITAVYAAPRFEGSAGAFFSWLPNRTYSNVTNVSVGTCVPSPSCVPSPTNIQIEMTKTTPPLVIPFGAANYRISSEYTWLGGRRGAVYLTAGVALNPYDTQVEYPAGLSFSWRYLMISPLYHLGHGTHLIDGEMVGQTWCTYATSATSTSSPPLCAGAPPAPSTKTYWTGAFAIGISVRVPTTFSSTNQ